MKGRFAWYLFAIWHFGWRSQGGNKSAVYSYIYHNHRAGRRTQHKEIIEAADGVPNLDAIAILRELERGGYIMRHTYSGIVSYSIDEQRAAEMLAAGEAYKAAHGIDADTVL